MEHTTVSEAVAFAKTAIDARKDGVPLFIGVSGPQGSGKTYLTTKLVDQLASAYPSLSVVGFSMDDFYLTYEEQLALNAAAADNSLLQGRGLPGTHDLGLLLEVLKNVKSGQPVQIPVYDKSQHRGKGDRAPQDQWVRRQRVDVAVLEGWFTGFQALDDTALRLRWFSLPSSSTAIRSPLYNIEDINGRLRQYHAVWAYFDCFILTETSDLQRVYNWRLQQEHATIAQNGAGMSDAEVVAFVDRYMPVYEVYYEAMCGAGLRVPNLKLVVDEARTLLASETF